MYTSSSGIVLGPGDQEIVEMMGAENALILTQEREIVHNYSHKQVQHEEGTIEDETDEIDPSDVTATSISLLIRYLLVDCEVTQGTSGTRVHNIRPIFSSSTPKKYLECGKKRAEVIISVNLVPWLIFLLLRYMRKKMHAKNGVDEEEQENECTNVWKSFERLDKREHEHFDGFASVEQFYEPRSSEETKDARVERHGFDLRWSESALNYEVSPTTWK